MTDRVDKSLIMLAVVSFNLLHVTNLLHARLISPNIIY